MWTAPGPDVAKQTPNLPVNFAYPAAAIAHVSSCRTVNVANFVFMRAQRFHKAVDTISGNPKDYTDTPIEQTLDEHI